MITLKKSSMKYKDPQDGSMKDVGAIIGGEKVPTKLSELENDKNFVDNTVSNLMNYYLKNETLSKDEIKQLIGAIPKFSIEVVDELPTTDISNTTVYLLTSSDEVNNLYTEYIYVNGKWEYLGKQNIDLTGYALVSDIPTKLSELVNDENFITITVSNLVNYYTKNETDEMLEDIRKTLDGKQPTGDYALKSEMPTTISQLEEDSTHRTVTDDEKQKWNNKSDFSGNYNDLENKPTIPTKTSELANDSGFITENDLPEDEIVYVTIPCESSEASKIKDLVKSGKTVIGRHYIDDSTYEDYHNLHIPQGDILWYLYMFSTVSMIDGTNPTIKTYLCNHEGDWTYSETLLADNADVERVANRIPKKLSELQDDVGYAYYDELPKKVSELENDSNYATQEFVEQEIANFDFIKIVTELPTQGLPNRTYLVAKSDTEDNDLYDEYLWVNDAWEFVGTKTIEVDLTEYAKISQLPTKTSQLTNDSGFITENDIYIIPIPSEYQEGLSLDKIQSIINSGKMVIGRNYVGENSYEDYPILSDANSDGFSWNICSFSSIVDLVQKTWTYDIMGEWTYTEQQLASKSYIDDILGNHVNEMAELLGGDA